MSIDITRRGSLLHLHTFRHAFLINRGNRCAPQLDLMPWICTGLQNLHSSNSFVTFQVLIDASNGVLAHYKERLAKAEKDLSEEKLWKTNLFITRLKPGTTDEDLIELCSR